MRPRVGFLGLGWIGRSRLEAIARSQLTEIVGLADTDPAAIAAAHALAPAAVPCAGLDELLGLDLDGVVIATPTAGHAQEAGAALARGAAVFCQKPLATSAEHARDVIAEARRADRLLGVDLSYRHVRAMEALRDVVQSGALGEVYSLELVFHNAYGPDKPWYYDRTRAGGGCLMDLGIHLVDQILWLTGTAAPSVLAARLFQEGMPFAAGAGVEDFATACLTLDNGGCATVTCSWKAPAGTDALIGITALGTRGGGRVRNLNGSFYDFVAERLDRARAEIICGPPDEWGGRAGVVWASALARGGTFDAAIEAQGNLAATLDAIYAESAAAGSRINCSSAAARTSAV